MAMHRVMHTLAQGAYYIWHDECYRFVCNSLNFYAQFGVGSTQLQLGNNKSIVPQNALSHAISIVSMSNDDE